MHTLLLSLKLVQSHSLRAGKRGTVYELIPLSLPAVAEPNGRHVFTARIAPRQRLRDGIVHRHIGGVGAKRSPPHRHAQPGAKG